MWRPPSISELTPMIFNMGLTHLGSGTSIKNGTVLYLMYIDRVVYVVDSRIKETSAE